MCVETTAARAGLPRIPVAAESFDFAVRADALSTAPVKAFLGALRSPEFARDLAKRVPGLTPLPDTGQVIWGEAAKRPAASRAKKR